MSHAASGPVPTSLASLLLLSRLLGRMEASPQAPAPAQYQLLTRRIAALLEELSGEPALPGVLDSFPATAEIYENLHYAHAGLLRSALEPSLQAEHLAQRWLQDAARRTSGKAAPQA